MKSTQPVCCLTLACIENSWGLLAVQDLIHLLVDSSLVTTNDGVYVDSVHRSVGA